MSLRRRIKRRAGGALLLAMLLVLNSTAQLRADCRGIFNPDEGVVSRGYADGDGKMHFRVSIASGVPGFQVAAIEEAISLWNNAAASNGIVLELAGSGDIHIVKDNSMYTGCAAYSPSISTIRYSEANMAWASTDTSMAARVFAHELGHAIGLDHVGGTGDVMAQAESEYAACDDTAENRLADPTADNAEMARGCAANAHATYAFGPPPAYFWERFDPCYELWLHEEFWYCDAEGCWLQWWMDTPWIWC